MAHHLIPQPDNSSPQSDSSSRNPLAETPRINTSLEHAAEVDFYQLRDKLATVEGVQLSPQISTDLALEILLHHITEEARIRTGASAASIVLQRDREWICRACSGENAPALGDRVHGDSGLIAECIRTGHTQLCDDSASDPRVDVETCRALDIRSVIAIPLVYRESLLGVLMAVSPKPHAFGREQQLALEAFPQAAVERIVQAAESSEVSAKPAEPELKSIAPELANVEEIAGFAGRTVSDENSASNFHRMADGPTNDSHRTPRVHVRNLWGGQREEAQSIKFATWMLAIILLGIGGFLIATAAQRLLVKNPAYSSPHIDSSENPPSATMTVVPSTPPPESIDGDRKIATTNDSATPGRPASTILPLHSADSTVPSMQEGSLVVYENGKEIFQLPASHEIARTAGVIYRVEPRYPAQAKAQGVQGQVVLDVLTTQDGSVSQLKLISGLPALANAAITAVKQWRFRPHVVNGQPVETQTRISIDFKLPEGSLAK